MNNQVIDLINIFLAWDLPARPGNHFWRIHHMTRALDSRLGAALIAGAWLTLAGCSTPPTNAQVGATAGAVIGGGVGSALTGGSTAGTVAGGGAGAAVGHEIGRRVT
jgi:osmotically inducible lipoprotein OsmB